MVDIGEHNGRRTAALITDMDTPLGRNIGNSLEVIEAVETLRGKGPADLTEVCLSLASGMLWLAGRGGAPDPQGGDLGGIPAGPAGLYLL